MPRAPLLSALVLALAGFTAGAASEPVNSPAQQLAAAVHARDVARIKLLLRAGAPPNATFAYTRCENIDSYVERRRPVLVAALGASTWQPTCHIGAMAERSRLVAGRAEIVRALLEAGANPDFRADDYCPPLCFAARHSPSEVVALLLKHGADPHRRHECASYLHQAAGNYQASTVQLLLQHGADPQQRDSKGATPLFEAASGEAWPPERAADQLHSVRLLLDRSLQSQRSLVDVSDQGGVTPLMRAATWGNVPVMKLLIARGASVHAADLRGYTSLMFAADSGSAAGARCLLERGARLSSPARNGETALTLAARRVQHADNQSLPAAQAVLNLLEDHAAGKRSP